MMSKVMNVKEYAKDKRYIIARDVDGTLWFWGACDDEEKAEQIANEIGGVVVENK